MKSETRRFCCDCGYPYWSADQGDQDKQLENGDVSYLRYVTRMAMGHYKGQPVLWRPLLEESGKTLFISENIIDCQPYTRDSFSEDGFAESSLRTWLNEELLFDMFNTRERSCVDGEVFCLSAEQAVALFDNDAERIAYPTAYAALRAGGKDYRSATCWWLSDPGNPDCAKYVRTDGQVYPFGASADFDYGVRPALWIKTAGSRR